MEKFGRFLVSFLAADFIRKYILNLFIHLMYTRNKKCEFSVVNGSLLQWTVILVSNLSWNISPSTTQSDEQSGVQCTESIAGVRSQLSTIATPARQIVRRHWAEHH